MLCSRCGTPMRVDLVILRDSLSADGSHVILQRCLNGHEWREMPPARPSHVEADTGRLRCETCGKLRPQACEHLCRLTSSRRRQGRVSNAADGGGPPSSRSLMIVTTDTPLAGAILRPGKGTKREILGYQSNKLHPGGAR